MNETLHFLERHGYWLIIAAILGRQACFPIPANLFLVAAGALARSHKLRLTDTLAISVLTFLAADLAWYEAGRRFGNRMLHLVCGILGDPSGCESRARSAFTNHRIRTLLLSKFLVGLDAVSAPMAGAAGFSVALFLVLDAVSAGLWSGCYAALGFIFSNQLDLVATHLFRLGIIAALLAAGACSFYLVRRLLHWLQFVRQFRLARITPERLRAELAAGENILLVDLQRPRNHQADAIPGAVRINPFRLEQYRDVDISPTQEVVLYCDSPGEFISARVALALRKRGIKNVHPLAGGLKAWHALGFPVTSSVRCPVFVRKAKSAGTDTASTNAG